MTNTCLFEAATFGKAARTSAALSKRFGWSNQIFSKLFQICCSMLDVKCTYPRYSRSTCTRLTY